MGLSAIVQATVYELVYRVVNTATWREKMGYCELIYSLTRGFHRRIRVDWKTRFDFDRQINLIEEVTIFDPVRARLTDIWILGSSYYSVIFGLKVPTAAINMQIVLYR